MRKQSSVEGRAPQLGLPRPVRTAPRVLATSVVSLVALLCCQWITGLQYVGRARIVARSASVHSEAVCDVAVRALLKLMHEPAQYRQDHDTPFECELKAVKAQDTEEATDLDQPAACIAVALAPLLPRTGQTPPCASDACVAQFAASSALPRGPPHHG